MDKKDIKIIRFLLTKTKLSDDSLAFITNLQSRMILKTAAAVQLEPRESTSFREHHLYITVSKQSHRSVYRTPPIYIYIWTLLKSIERLCKQATIRYATFMSLAKFREPRYARTATATFFPRSRHLLDNEMTKAVRRRVSASDAENDRACV